MPAGRRHRAPPESTPAPAGRPVQDPAPPRAVLVSGHFEQVPGYRVIRQRGSGSWLLTFTVAGRGRYRQPGLELDANPGDAVLLAPESYNDYGVALAADSAPAADRVDTQAAAPAVVGPAAAGADSSALNAAASLAAVNSTAGTVGAGAVASSAVASSAVESVAPRGWHFHWIHFQPRESVTPWRGWPEIGRGLYQVAVASAAVRVRIEQAFERIHRDLLTPGAQVAPLVHSAVEEILFLIDRENATAAAPFDARIAAAMERIRADLAGAHSVEALARVVALSPSRFAHLFKQQTGESVTQWILKMKIQQAQRLLAFTDERISDVAYTLGFQSPFYFSKQFRLWTRQSPREYRRTRRV